MPRCLYSACLTLLLAGCLQAQPDAPIDADPATISRPSAVAPSFDHTAFDTILARAVSNELVDYTLIRREFLPDLTAYLDRLADTRPDIMPLSEQLAFYINLYNATMIKAVIDRYRPGYRPDENDFSVFKDPLVRLVGKTISLNHLENNIIRPTFQDPRIHVALVCGARSCPPLLPRAYRAAELDKTLDENMRRFVTDGSRNRIDGRDKKLYLSSIFDWYADDFGGRANLATYIDRYHPEYVAGYDVSFQPYSWELNAQTDQ